MDTKRSLRLALESLERRDTPAFATLPTFTAGTTQPAVVVSADFNGDGFADIAVGNAGGISEEPNIAIALGKGDGTFALLQTLSEPMFLRQPQSLSVAELNGDGHLDLVVSTFSPATETGSLIVYAGQADGSFANPNVLSGQPSLASALGDFNRDGILDIVSIQPDTLNLTGGYEIFTGNGAGVFAAFANGTGFPFNLNRVVTADFDSDGNGDFVALNQAGSEVYTFFGDGKGTFTVPNGFAALQEIPLDIAVGDFDGNEQADLVIASDAGLKFHRYQGARQFDFNGVFIAITNNSTAARITAADIDLNGVADIVSVSQTEANVYYGSFGKGFTADASNPMAIAGITARTDVSIGDVNGDERPDFVVVRADGASLTGSNGTVFLNLAPVRTFTTIAAAPNPGIEGNATTLTVTVEFPGNPFPFGVRPSGSVAIELNNAFFGNATLVNGVGTLPANLPVGTHGLLARFPGDSRFQASVSDPIAITILPAGGGTIISYEVTGLPTLPGLGADRVASGNFINDGFSDIALGSGPGRPAELTLIDGRSRVELGSIQPFGPDFTGGLMVAAGDIDGDGIDDVAVAADVGGGPRVSLYLFRNGTLELTNNFFALDPEFRGGLRIALGDLDGDGYADLVVTGGPGAGPRVATYDGATLTDFHTPERLFNDFFAMDSDLRLGMFVAVGDLDGDGYAEIAVSPDVGGGPRVLIFDGESMIDNDPECVADFFVGDPNSRGGLRLAIRDVRPESEGFDLELIAGDGPGAGSTVRVYSGFGVLFSPNPVPIAVTELLPGYLGGVFVA